MQIRFLSPGNELWPTTLQSLRHDIYHLPQYLQLEARRNDAIAESVLVTDGDKILLVPYLQLRCEPHNTAIGDATSDIASPYGYAGILLNESATASPSFVRSAYDSLKEGWLSKGICSVFLRLHPILNEEYAQSFFAEECQFEGETVSVDLSLPSQVIRSATRRGHKNTINKCKRMGMEASFVNVREYLEPFHAIYQETMRRVGAEQKYYSFDLDYFRELATALKDRLHMCIVKHAGEIASAGLYSESGGIVQSLLGGTIDKFVPLSPGSLETDHVRFWAQRRGHGSFHLGGGVGCKRDSLYAFKSGFSKRNHRYYTMRVILDQKKYRSLINQKAKTSNVAVAELENSTYFPAYRVSNTQSFSPAACGNLNYAQRSLN